MVSLGKPISISLISIVLGYSGVVWLYRLKQTLSRSPVCKLARMKSGRRGFCFRIVSLGYSRRWWSACIGSGLGGFLVIFCGVASIRCVITDGRFLLSQKLNHASNRKHHEPCGQKELLQSDKWGLLRCRIENTRKLVWCQIDHEHGAVYETEGLRNVLASGRDVNELLIKRGLGPSWLYSSWMRDGEKDYRSDTLNRCQKHIREACESN